MDISVVGYQLRQSADIEVYGLQELNYLIYHQNQERFLQSVMTSYLYQEAPFDHVSILTLLFKHW